MQRSAINKFEIGADGRRRRSSFSLVVYSIECGPSVKGGVKKQVESMQGRRSRRGISLLLALLLLRTIHHRPSCCYSLHQLSVFRHFSQLLDGAERLATDEKNGKFLY